MIQQLGPQDASLFWHILMSLGPFRSFHPARDMMSVMNSRMYRAGRCSIHLWTLDDPGLAPWLWWRAPHPRIRWATTWSTAFPSAGAKGRSSQSRSRTVRGRTESSYTVLSYIKQHMHMTQIWLAYKIWFWNCTNWLGYHTQLLLFPSCHCFLLLWFLTCHLVWDLVGWYRGHLR